MNKKYYMHRFFLILITEILVLGACKSPGYYKDRFTLEAAEKPLEVSYIIPSLSE
jgi:hypothetical protein